MVVKFRPLLLVVFSFVSIYAGAQLPANDFRHKNSKVFSPTKTNSIYLGLPINTYKTAGTTAITEGPDSCIRTFFKQYGNNSKSIYSSQILKTNDGHLMVISRERENPYVADEESSVTLLDTNGNIIATKLFPLETHISFSKVIQLRNGNFVAAGCLYYGYNSLDQYVVEFDQHLNILWQKKLVTSKHYNSIVEILESAEGDLYCYISDDMAQMKETRHLLKLNSSGDPVWFKDYDAADNIFAGPGEIDPKMLELGDYIYLKFNKETDLSPHLIKISKSDGRILWVKKYAMNSDILNAYAFSIFSMITDKTNIYLCGRNYSNSIILKISPEGEELHSLYVRNGDVSISGLTYKGANKLIATVGVNLYPKSIYGILELDTAFTILRKQYLQIPGSGATFDLIAYSDSVSYGVGNLYNTDPYLGDFTLEKFNFNSSFASCAVSAPAVSFNDISIPVISSSSDVTDLPLPECTEYNGNFISGTTRFEQYYCGNNSLCNSIKITGSKIICDTTNIYRFYSNRNEGCDGLVNWELDTAQGQVDIISSSDSVLSLKIKRAGSIRIKAKIFGSCSWIGDSMIVEAGTIDPLALNLGPDTTLCAGNRILLNAHSGFNSYSWQNGSHDSSFLVEQPGKYYVTTTNVCGGMFSDSINVFAAQPIPFDIGPDISLCQNDTAIITAPAGFLHYQWSSYNIIADTMQAVKVFPVRNFMYKVLAEKTPGCFATDSLYVTVNSLQPIHLGNDTSFCANQSITLDAGPGYDTYLWSNGATAQKIIASQEGGYSVKATLHGCTASDTLHILNVYPLPSFSLGNDTTLCQNQQLQYHFNLQNADFKWNTGNTSNSEIIQLPGTYWLQVIQNGCATSDTVKVVYQSAPVVNLGNDTTLCEGRTLLLNAYNDNASYLWQDGSTASSQLVKKPGIYFITANIHNCIAADSITVSYKARPYFSLGRDTLLCQGESYVLSPVISTNAALLWQDGSTGALFTASKEGLYFLVATNECGSYSDSIMITTSFCNIIMPTGFTPNGDGINDVFKVKYPFPVKEFRLLVFDRWGNKVFETNKIDQGWDGSFKGEPSVQSTYVWVISFIDINNKPKQLKGIVTLLR